MKSDETNYIPNKKTIIRTGKNVITAITIPNTDATLFFSLLYKAITPITKGTKDTGRPIKL